MSPHKVQLRNRFSLVWLLCLLPFAHSWNPLTRPTTAAVTAAIHRNAPRVGGAGRDGGALTAVGVRAAVVARKVTAPSPYIDLAFCPLRNEPWSCAREQSARLLDVWDEELHTQWQALKVEADRQLNATLQRRGFSNSALPIKEKPSTLLRKIEIGTNYMKEYLAETMDGFLGREYGLVAPNAEATKRQPIDPNDYDDVGGADGGDEEDEPAGSEDGEELQDDATDEDAANEDHTDSNADSTKGDDPLEDETHQDIVASEAFSPAGSSQLENASGAGGVGGDEEFIEIDAALKGGVQAKKDKKHKKKKKKGQHGESGASPLVLVQLDHGAQSGGHGHGGQHIGHAHGGGAEDVHVGDEWNDHGTFKPVKHKRKKRKNKKKKKHGHGGGHEGGDDSVVWLEKPSSDSLVFDLLEEFAEDGDLLEAGHGGHKHHPSKYGRSNGVTRGKKKKKKKALAKLVLLGTFLKAKIELLLKLLGAHLQIKFFAIALIGLLINIARFWIDVKRGGAPQKVVYVEHAHHQHHYEDHGSEDWSEPGGSYWKRSLQTDPTIEQDSFTEDSYHPQTQQAQPARDPQYDAQHLAYRNQWQ